MNGKLVCLGRCKNIRWLGYPNQIDTVLMLGQLLQLVKQIWDSDERPEARRFATGCFVLLIVAFIAFSAYFKIVW